MLNFLTVTPQSPARQSSLLRRASATLPVLAILAAATFFTLPPVWAQVPQQFSQQTAFNDPPGRVARMNLAEGPVSYAPAGTGAPRWTPALLNRPLTTGDRLWTGQRARSELHIGSTAVRLGEQTSLDLLALDDDTSQLRLAQGTMKLRVRQLFDGQRIEINTPNLAFVITQPGDYRIDANPASNFSAGTTRVVVQQGAGTIYGDGGALVNISSGQQANFTDTQLTPAGPAPEVQDGFDAWAHQRDRLEDQSVSARYVPREVVGYQQLDSYGDWQQNPTYGAVWLPRAVPVNWAPYRAGHWSWIAPWGWTWVDDAPWGFAPFHYGRWAQIGPRWGWVPGQLAARPVYAPALVAFIGGSAGGVNWNVSIDQQAAQPGLGWFPLAPGEAFHPAYQHSPRYITNVNQNIAVTNINVTNNYRYQQRGDAVSVMSADDFARGQRVRPEWQRLNPADLGRAQVLVPERGGLPQRLVGLAGLGDLPRLVSPAALPPAAVAVRPVVTSQSQAPGQREERRDGRRDERRDERQNDPQANARAARPAEVLGQQPRPGQTVPVIPPVLPQQGAAPDRSAFDAEQRARAEHSRQQAELARQQQDRAAAQRPPAGEPLGQRALREQALRNGNGSPNPAALPVQPGRPDAGRDPIEQVQREQQRLQRDQQRQQVDAARQQEQQRRQADESLGQRALQEQAGRQQQAQRQLQEQAQAQQAQQAQQVQQRAQQDQQRQAREQQQQQLQRQQQDQARQATQQQSAQQQAQRQQAQEQQGQQAQQAQQRAQQDQARQQQAAQQQQQLQQRAQQEQQRQARDQQQQAQQRQPPDQPREAGRERQPQRRADAPTGVPPKVDERGNRQRD